MDANVNVFLLCVQTADYLLTHSPMSIILGDNMSMLCLQLHSSGSYKAAIKNCIHFILAVLSKPILHSHSILWAPYAQNCEHGLCPVGHTV